MNHARKSSVGTNRRIQRILLAAASLAVSNCVPFPHRQQESPEIVGRLVEDDRPLAKAKVRLVVNPASTVAGCPSEATSTTTDDDGRFSFAGTNYFSAFIVMGDRYDTWRICFDKPSGETATFQHGGYWGGPPTVDVHCNVKSDGTQQKPICSVTDRRH